MSQRERRYFAPLICLVALGILLFGYLLTEGRGINFATHGVAQTENKADFRADFLICLDPGHGGLDPGAVEVTEDGKVVREKDFTLALARRIGARLEEMGYRVCYTRKGDARMSKGNARDELHARLAFCNAQAVDLILSLHTNAYRGEGRAYGARIYYHPETEGANGAANLFAESISQHTGAMIGRSARTEADGTYAILSDTSVVSLLLEVGFFTDAAEFAAMQTEEWQTAMTEALAGATDRYFAEKNRAADICGSVLLFGKMKDSPQKRNKDTR